MMVLVRNLAVAHQRGVSPVVEGEILRRMLGAEAEAVAYRPIETDLHGVTTASTSYGRSALNALIRQDSQSFCRWRSTTCGNADSRLAATFVAASSVAQAPRPRSTTDQRSNRARSSCVATPSRSASVTAAIAAVPLKHEPHWPAFSLSKYAMTEAATATGQSSVRIVIAPHPSPLSRRRNDS